MQCSMKPAGSCASKHHSHAIQDSEQYRWDRERWSTRWAAQRRYNRRTSHLTAYGQLLPVWGELAARDWPLVPHLAALLRKAADLVQHAADLAGILLLKE